MAMATIALYFFRLIQTKRYRVGAKDICHTNEKIAEDFVKKTGTGHMAANIKNREAQLITDGSDTR